MKNTTKKRLFDAWRACSAITQFAAGVEIEEYENDLKLRSAVERQIEIVGEALNIAGEENPTLDKWLPDLRRIVGMRNRIIHGYDSVDNRIVWDVIQTKIPKLQQQLAELLDEES